MSYYAPDPYAKTPMQYPQDRHRDPLDPCEPYKRDFTQAPVIRPFPPTGSFYYRYGVFTGRSMTLKEQWFEQFVNEMQARHDELSDLREWRRRKDVEEAAIAHYHDLGGNILLADTRLRMKKFDQEDMEIQCERKKRKADNLNPQRAWEKMELDRQQAIKAREAEERARDEERIRIQFVEDFKAIVPASSHPLANTRIVTNAVGAQQARQQSELTPLELDGCCIPNKRIPSAGEGSSRHEEQNQKFTEAELCHQFQDQARIRSEDHCNPGQAMSSVEAEPSREQEPKQKLSGDEIRRQFRDQARSRAEEQRRSSQAILSVEAGPSEEQEQKTKLSPEEVCRQFLDRVQSPPATEATTVRSVPSAPAAPARGKPVKELDVTAPVARGDSFTAKIAGYQSMGIIQGVHLPRGSVLVKEGPGLGTLYPKYPSATRQSLASGSGRPFDTLQLHTITGSNEQTSTGTSSRQTWSQGSTPLSSSHSSPPKTPPESSPNAHAKQAETRTNDDDDRNDGSDNSKRLLELERKNHPRAKSTRLWEKLMNPAVRTDPLLNAIIGEHIARPKLLGSLWAEMNWELWTLADMLRGQGETADGESDGVGDREGMERND
ncbi:MAG: hypothetical protein ASARMPREDX12_003844 [Alectoria sarmentosa]|nr:MAG: hypothetical protein ASARMPREDX12_003844 [Alectoria sarmentosa]